MNAYYDDGCCRIYHADALEALREIPDESVQLVITSPPFYGLRCYAGGSDIVWGDDNNCQHEWSEGTQGLQHENRNNLRGAQEEVQGKTRAAFIQKYDRITSGFCTKCGAWKGQLGLEPTPELYVEHLMMIFREVKRVLRKDGSFYLNIGDTFGTHACQGEGYEHNFRNPNHQANSALIPVSKPKGWEKCMLCIPERVLFAMLQDDWILRNKICWYKPNHMPSSVKDRYTNAYEFVYFFVKNPKYYFDLDSVREPLSQSSIKRISEPSIFDQQGGPKEHVMAEQIPAKGGGDVKQPSKILKRMAEQMPRHHGSGPQYKLSGLGRGSRDNRKELQVPGQYPQGIHRKRHSGYYGPNGEYLVNKYGKNPGDLWEITTQPFPGAHYAIFPEKLCERPILASSKPGDIVLDPLMGSGTALVVAKKLGRKAIGIDIVESYCEIAKRRLEQISLPLI